jgi:hypothetical protein
MLCRMSKSVRLNEMHRGYDLSILKTPRGVLAARVQENVPRCWFCDTKEPGSTNEHIVAQWLQKELGVAKQTIAPFRIDMSVGGATHQRNEYQLGRLVCGEVCADCNNGWMSKLESDAQEPLMALIRGEDVDEAGLSVIARWMTKTVVMFNVSMPYRLLWSKADRHAIREGFPPRTNVSVSRAEGTYDDAVNWAQRSPMGGPLSRDEARNQDVLNQIGMVHVLSLRLAGIVLHCVHQQGGRQFVVTQTNDGGQSPVEIYPTVQTVLRRKSVPVLDVYGIPMFTPVVSPYFRS